MKNSLSRFNSKFAEELKAADNKSKVKINGHEVLLSEYMKNPKHYNDLPIVKEYGNNVIQDCINNRNSKENLISKYKEVEIVSLSSSKKQST